MAISRKARVVALVLLVVVLGAGLGLPVTYSWFVLGAQGGQWLTSDYMMSLMSGWTATVIGLGVGLPVALWVNRIALKETETKDKIRADEEAADREVHVLKVITQELREGRVDVAKASSDVIEKFHFSVGRWNAIVAAGDLPRIRDLDTIQAAAAAYEDIEALNQVAGQWLQSVTQSAGSQDFEDALHRILISAARDAQAAIDFALPLLDARATLVSQR